MMLTEEQAKEKWCPFARYASQYDGAGNRWKQSEPTPHALNPVPCRCIASECMAWRWGEYVSTDGQSSRFPFRSVRFPESDTANAAPPTETPATPTRGYCGLAGPVQP